MLPFYLIFQLNTFFLILNTFVEDTNFQSKNTYYISIH